LEEKYSIGRNSVSGNGSGFGSLRKNQGDNIKKTVLWHFSHKVT
jgi:hypothetical protein